MCFRAHCGGQWTVIAVNTISVIASVPVAIEVVMCVRAAGAVCLRHTTGGAS